MNQKYPLDKYAIALAVSATIVGSFNFLWLLGVITKPTEGGLFEARWFYSICSYVIAAMMYGMQRS